VSARTSRRGRLLAVAALLALTAATAGCGGSEPSSTSAPKAELPRPPGVQDPAESPSEDPGPQEDCDREASLQPGSLPSPGQMPAGSTMARIARSGRLVVGVDQTTYLFGYREPSSGEIVGFDVDIAREVAKAIFGDPDRVQLKAVSSKDRIPFLKSGQVDLVARTMTITCERKRDVAFSTTYFTAHQRILVRRGSGIGKLDDLGGKKVCATDGSTSIRTLAKAKSKPIPVSAVEWTDCMVLLQQGQVAAVSTDNSILAGLAAQDPSTAIVGPSLSDEPYGLAMRKGADDFVRFVNAVLARLRSDGTWGTIYDRWLGPLGPAPSPPSARYSG
jgi:polar amino acid transport system substrate-binding protein